MPDFGEKGLGLAGLGNVWADTDTQDSLYSGASHDRTFEGIREKLVRAYQGYAFMPAKPDGEPAKLQKFPPGNPHLRAVIKALEARMEFLGVDGDRLEEIKQEADARFEAAHQSDAGDDYLGGRLDLEEPA